MPCCRRAFKQILYITISSSSFAIILIRKRVLVAMLSLSDCCVVLRRCAIGLSAVCDCGIS